jgi:beta-galactosidase
VGITNRTCDFVDTFDGANKNLGNTGYIYSFPDVRFTPGKLEAIGRVGNQAAVKDVLETAGIAEALKIIPHTSPAGLLADGSDVAFFDVEVVDAIGRRCPTDEARLDFRLDGPATWRGGYNSGITNSVNQPYLNSECGIARVAIRSMMKSGEITLTASRSGLKPGVVKLKSMSVVRDDASD